ncbi:hypothetical protein [Tenacibaculum agarivorans]|uniref:hypothetical protein n=1 Tax=Tenacibaculum agarivorans TaxID=1908389 RepID=UPI00094B8AB0|nr:hypothetical protein [Tenacibaculum agarivorans]
MKNVLWILLLLLVFSCRSKNKTSEIQFYHWKSDASLSLVEKEAVRFTKGKKAYIHYFDVVLTNGMPYPEAVIQNIDPFFKTLDVVPIVFIKNSILKKQEVSIEKLAEQTEKLVQQIHETYFNKKASEIQIDCDWTNSTKEKYFEFLKLLKRKVKISATIRLHQIKLKKQTGIPPVDYGALMLYNVGDLANFAKNSILSKDIVKQYIKETTKYPLELDIALPLFSQVVIKNNENRLRLITTVFEDDFIKDSLHFKKESENVYRVIKKKLYKGHYLYKGFTLKLEKTSVDEILASYAIVNNSKLNIRNTILYHLDTDEIEQQEFKKLIKALR